MNQPRRHDHLLLLPVSLALLALAGAPACSDDEDPPPEEEPEPDNNDDPVNNDDAPTWTYGTVEDGGVGYQPEIASGPGGEVGVAYYVTEGVNAGPCPNLGDDPPDGVRWPIHYASLSGDAWAVETVAEPFFLGQPPGLAFAFAPDGTPTVSAMAGEPLELQNYCGANDVGLYERSGDGSWQVDVAVTSSGQAASGEPGSDFGEVVGYWPGLAFDAEGNPAVAYKDVHSGSIQSDDLRRADLELAWRRGGWDALPVNIGNGAGDYNKLLFDAEGNPTIAFYTRWEQVDMANRGVWVTRSPDGGATWEEVQLFASGTAQGPSPLIDDEGTLHVAYYNSSRGYPELATNDDPASFGSVSSGWTLEDMGDSRYDEGYAPSLAQSPDGYMAMAYYRCTRAMGELGDCTVADDALIFAWEDGGVWTREVVDEGGDGLCGMDPALTFDGSGRAVIAYTCEVAGEDGLLDIQLKYASRRPLP